MFAVNQHGIYRHVIATDRADLSLLTAPEIEPIATGRIIAVILKRLTPLDSARTLSQSQATRRRAL